MDWTLEVVVVPVSDIDRAKAFYADQVGFVVDFDKTMGEGRRVVQLTPPGSDHERHPTPGLGLERHPIRSGNHSRASQVPVGLLTVGPQGPRALRASSSVDAAWLHGELVDAVRPLTWLRPRIKPGHLTRAATTGLRTPRRPSGRRGVLPFRAKITAESRSRSRKLQTPHRRPRSRSSLDCCRW